METAVSEFSATSPHKYLRTRVDFKTDAYTRKGDRYRRWYLTAATTSAVAAAAVPVLINLNINNMYPTVLSLLVTVLVGVEGIFHWREHWKNYDLMKSYLRQEACLFEAKAGPYRKQSESDAFMLLVERVEEAIAKERSQTIQMRTSVSRQGHESEEHKREPADSPP